MLVIKSKSKIVEADSNGSATRKVPIRLLDHQEYHRRQTQRTNWKGEGAGDRKLQICLPPPEVRDGV